MRLHFLGANRQVTGSRYLLETASANVMIDCGLFQERCCLDRNWAEPPIDPDRIDAMLLTHGHLDHSGLIPRFAAQGYGGPIFSTHPSVDLSQVVLEDSASIQEEDAAYKRRRHRREKRTGAHPETPLYTKAEAEASFRLFRPVAYATDVAVAEGVSVRFRDAGHILGSAMLDVTVTENGKARRVIFSGDIGPWHKVLTADPTVFQRADAVIMESTYGDRDHGPTTDIPDRLEREINGVIERGGNLVIPTFAIDRAQAMLYYIGHLVRDERIPRITIFLDSPMAIDVTRIYKRYRHLLDDDVRADIDRGEHPFQFPGLHFVRTGRESRAINSIRGSCVIMAGSGMCTGGRVKHHLRQNLPRPESTVLFVGYQAMDTLGRQIEQGAEEVRIHGQTYPVRARIRSLHGLSAHAGQSDLLRWIGHFEPAPPRLFLTHGEMDAAEALAGRIKDDLGAAPVIPAYEEVVQL